MKKLILIIMIIIICLSCEKEKLKTKEEVEPETAFTGIYNDRETVLCQLRQPGIKKLNINNMFEISIPENMEILSLNQRLIIDSMNPRYYVSHQFEITYYNKYFTLNVNCYGNDPSIINGKNTFNLRSITAGITSQITMLQNNYYNNPFYNKNNVKLSKLVTYWGSQWSSDIFGLYFELSDKFFNECEISIYNIWGELSNIDIFELNEKNYREISITENEIMKNIIRDLDFMENSISYSLSNDSLIIIPGNIGEVPSNDELDYYFGGDY